MGKDSVAIKVKQVEQSEAETQAVKSKQKDELKCDVCY